MAFMGCFLSFGIAVVLKMKKKSRQFDFNVVCSKKLNLIYSYPQHFNPIST